MRAASAIAIVLMFVASSDGAEQEKFYFVGEAKLSSPEGKPLGSQVILFEKTHDPENSRMIERAIVVSGDGKVEARTMRLAVKENTFKLTDDTGTIEGSGTLFGPAWKWTYFQAKYTSKSGIRIEDENFMTDDSVITARKRVMGPDDRVLMFMEMSLKNVTPKTFEILAAALLKK